MTIVSGKSMINNARQNGYAIGAFNTNNLEWTEAILRVAQEQQAPTIVAASMGAIKYMGGFKTVVDLVHDLHDELNITVPIAIHLDHGNYEAAKSAIAAGFTSIMFDGSDLPIDENIAKTQEIVKLAHAKGISVEAEVGTIGGEEDGIIGDGEIAPIKDAVAMVNTGIDFLAAGIGNIHGPYPDDWTGLHLDHLQNVTTAVDEAAGHKVPIVLHGGSGIPDNQIKTAISMGVSKVNVNSEAQLAFHEALREFILADHDLEGKNYDPRKLLATGVQGIESALTDRISVFGNAQKA